MDLQFLANLTVFVVVLVAFAIGVRFLVPIVAQHFKGAGGGWGRLWRVYATERELPKQVTRRQNIVVGQVLYRRCTTVGFDDAGLYLERGFPLSIFDKRRLFIPWTDFKRVEEGRLFWQKAVLVSLGEPLVGTITVPIDLFDRAIRPAIGKVIIRRKTGRSVRSS